MTVRQARVSARQSSQPANPQAPNSYQTASFPSPTLGLISNSNLATPQPGGAAVLTNFFPTATGAVLRRGTGLYATLGDGTADTTSLFTYVNGNNQKMFATTGSSLFDITTVTALQNLVTGDGDFLVNEDGDILSIGGTDPVDGFDSLMGGDWSVVQFGTPGGMFLRAVNGIDTPLVFDGADWATTPAITGVDPTTLSGVWVAGNRCWFIQKDTMNAYYLPAASIGGAAVLFPLGGVMPRGGALLFGHSWSVESGAGLTQNCAFISTAGEAAIYQGTDPSTAATWSLVGVYRIGNPLGPKAFIPAGGDLVIATDLGFVPLSQALQKDYAALSPSAVSYPIETLWNASVSERSGADWNCVVWSASQMVVAAPPTVPGTDPVMYVANARTGAWGVFENWSATCLVEFGTRAFFGSSDGKVIEANITGLDQGAPYTGSYIPLLNDLGSTGMKTTSMARAVLRGASPVNDRLAMQADFALNMPPPPDAASAATGSSWGVGLWGEAVWGSTAGLNTYQNWRSAPANGYALAPSLQITSGSIIPLDTQIVRMDVTYQSQDTVV